MEQGAGCSGALAGCGHLEAADPAAGDGEVADDSEAGLGDPTRRGQVVGLVADPESLNVGGLGDDRLEQVRVDALAAPLWQGHEVPEVRVASRQAEAEIELVDAAAA